MGWTRSRLVTRSHGWVTEHFGNRGVTPVTISGDLVTVQIATGDKHG